MSWEHEGHKLRQIQKGLIPHSKDWRFILEACRVIGMF